MSKRYEAIVVVVPEGTKAEITRFSESFTTPVVLLEQLMSNGWSKDMLVGGKLLVNGLATSTVST